MLSGGNGEGRCEEKIGNKRKYKKLRKEREKSEDKERMWIDKKGGNWSKRNKEKLGWGMFDKEEKILEKGEKVCKDEEENLIRELEKEEWEEIGIVKKILMDEIGKFEG